MVVMKKQGLRITKVYTRTGDRGKTRLAGGQPVWKDALRVEAYGTVDELNAILGVARAFNAKTLRASGARELDAELRWMQNKLFDVGGLLATVQGQQFPNMPRVTDRDIARLERMMDACQSELPPLKEFILPGGGVLAGLLHQARTVCRRAERRCVTLSRHEAVDPAILIFLNRLSDALFVRARWTATRRGEPEWFWSREPS
jgi:cob(I)alamin adenosyltransferase